MKKIIILWILFFVASYPLSAIDYGKYNQLAEFNFENDFGGDVLENLSSTLMNQAQIVHDEDRDGNVLSYNAGSKGCLRLDTNPLSDTISISFWAKREDATPWGNWRMFMAFYGDDGSNIYLTPLTSWGNSSYLIVENKEYSSYKSLAGKALDNQWHHYTVVFADHTFRFYVDGELQADFISLYKLSDFNFSKFYFGCNPELNYPMTGKMDDLKIFHYALHNNQVEALFNEEEIPEPAFPTIEPLPAIHITADYEQRFQTIQNIGASDGWNAQTTGLYLTEDKKERIAEILFSTDTLPDGTPKGVGLSSWRFNIGAGTAEQGEASRITTYSRRTECFLNPDMITYDWSKQAGQQWFLKKAALTYNVPDLIGWQNSPPVYFTKRGLGFREYGDSKSSILKKEYYPNFGNFLADVFNHFKEEGIDFKYLSPLNEPQWEWQTTSAGGTVSQEGTPWMNQEIMEVVKAIDKAFTEKGVTTKQFIGEAGAINYLLNTTSGYYGNQLHYFWNPSSALAVTDCPSLSDYVSAHSYWSDDGAEIMVNQRRQLREQINSLNDKLSYWQTEYCLLGYGYKFGHKDGMNRTLSAMECGISAARIIHNDFVEADATGWQWWTTFEFDSGAGAEERFALIRFELNKNNTNGVYRTTKLLYTLGNYSRFVRPGMQRIDINRSDDMDAVSAVTNQMFSAYTDGKQVVIVAINARTEPVPVVLDVENLPDNMQVETFRPYVTSGNPLDNIKAYPAIDSGSEYVIPGTSVITFVGEITDPTSIKTTAVQTCKIYPNPASEFVQITADVKLQEVKFRDTSGRIVLQKILNQNSETIYISNLNKGIYIVSVKSEEGTYNQKIQIK